VGVGEVTDYIAGLEEPARGVLERYRARAVAVVPEAEEGASYGMPALRYRGRPLVSVVTTKQGYSVFPFSPAVVESVVAEVDGSRVDQGRHQVHRPAQAARQGVRRAGEARRDEIDAALAKPRRR
jgi:uncharacterized protein YdhG (YjbR/CyaY superfamily)